LHGNNIHFAEWELSIVDGGLIKWVQKLVFKIWISSWLKAITMEEKDLAKTYKSSFTFII